MKAKLGTLQQVGNSQYTGFRGLLKKSIQAILQDKTNGHIVSYVLIKGDQLNWKCGGKSPEKPLLFLDPNNNSLVKDIKASKDIDLKGYSYGQCKVTQVGTDVTVYLCPEKGKLTQPTEFKPLEKIFKKFKPKLFFEVVADLATVMEDAMAEDVGALESGDNNLAARAKAIGLNLIQYHNQFKVLDKNIKAMDKSNPKMQQLRVQRNKILKHIKHLTTAWTEDIATHQDQLSLETNWVELYNYWATFFAKQKAAKEGKTTDVNAQKAAEERLYAKALEDLERFSNDLARGTTIDPDIIENDIITLEKHLNDWQKFGKTTSAFPEELKAMEEHLKTIQAAWKVEKPKMQAYHEAVQRLEQALEVGSSEEEIETLYKEMETLAKS